MLQSFTIGRGQFDPMVQTNSDTRRVAGSPVVQRPRHGPWLSVVVPVYNGERYLSAALESVVAQDDGGIEIVVSDDGSTDRSTWIADAYRDHGLVRRIDGPKSRNWVANSNHAVREARGRFVAFLHQDDLWLPGRLQSARETQARFPDRSLWLGPSRFIDATGRLAGRWAPPLDTGIGHVDSARFIERLLVQNFIAMPAPIFERSAFERVGGMDESLWYTADWDLWLKLGAIAGVGFWPEPRTAFRIHVQSQTMVSAATPESQRIQCETVRSRHLSRIADLATRDAVNRAGRFACELNTSLASLVGKRGVRWRQLLAAATGLGLHGAYRFARDSTILQRSVARLRVGLATRRGVR